MLRPYAQALLPLVSVLFSIPTLEEVAAGRLLMARPIAVDLREFAKDVKGFILTERALDNSAWPALLTHLFIHEDFKHLYSNVETLVVNGFTAYIELGALGLYAIFFASGAASGLNRRGRDLQVQAQIEGSIPRAPDYIGPMQMPERARDWWETLRQRTAEKAAPVLRKHQEAFGASGAACGLMGYGFGVALLKLGSTMQVGGAGDAVFFHREDAVELRGDLNAGAIRSLGSLNTLLNLLQSCYFLFNEWRLATGEEGLTRVDHSGHLTGFATGVGFALLSHGVRWLNKPEARWFRQVQPFGHNSGGRRLGRRGE